MSLRDWRTSKFPSRPRHTGGPTDRKKVKAKLFLSPPPHFSLSPPLTPTIFIGLKKEMDAGGGGGNQRPHPEDLKVFSYLTSRVYACLHSCNDGNNHRICGKIFQGNFPPISSIHIRKKKEQTLATVSILPGLYFFALFICFQGRTASRRCTNVNTLFKVVCQPRFLRSAHFCTQDGMGIVG